VESSRVGSYDSVVHIPAFASFYGLLRISKRNIKDWIADGVAIEVDRDYESKINKL
jgi:hypothetical protein